MTEDEMEKAFKDRLKEYVTRFFAKNKQPKLVGWRTADYLHQTSSKDVAKNWALYTDVLPVFEGDVNSKPRDEEKKC
jgi:hypothetical protein